MKYVTILFPFLILIGIQSYGQDSLLAMFKGTSGKWGFLNLKGEVVIQPRYAINYLRDFSCGVARVDKTKFINTKGEKIVFKQNIYSSRQYVECLLAVRIHGKWGYMDTEGELVIPAIYNNITDFSNGFAGVSNKDGFFVIDKEGKKYEIKTENKKLNKNVKLINIKQFHDGLAVIVVHERHGPNNVTFFGFINEKGEVIIEPKYYKVGHFHEGMAWFRTLDDKLGFFNKAGEIAIEPIYLAVGHFVGGVAWAKTIDLKIGYIDKKGEWVIEPKLLSGKDFDPISGIARVKDENGWAYINMKGEVKHTEHSNVYKKFMNGFCVTKKGKKWGCIDSTLGFVIQPVYDGLTNFYNGYARAKIKGKWGVINKKGEWVIEPIYKNIRAFTK